MTWMILADQRTHPPLCLLYKDLKENEKKRKEKGKRKRILEKEKEEKKAKTFFVSFQHLFTAFHSLSLPLLPPSLPPLCA